ncbi:MAG TPA: glycosyltransferase family 4 protein [Gemmatimonadaceae bacterium]|nr:glycosyltransferase family 4 protein [Gemmatimonadaceae bacterium]
MRIAVFSEYYAPHHGGVEARVQGLAEALVALGHEVTVHTVGYNRALSETETMAGVRVRRCPAPRYGSPLLGGTRRGLWSMLKYARWCRRRARDGFDVFIYEEFPFLHALMAPAAARARGVFDWCEYREHPVFAFMQRRLPRRFRWNTAVSDGVAAGIAHASGRPVRTLPSGIRLEAYRARPRAERQGLLYVGRLWPHKNLGLAINAFERLCARGYRGGFTIAGDGPEGDALRRRIDASPHARRIVLAGAVAEAEKVELLARAEVFLILSEREGFPAAVAEAMASGLPIVTADYPGNGGAGVVRAYGAGVVSAPAADAVADAVEQALANWERFSASGRAAAAGLDWKALAMGLLAGL